MNEKQLIAAQRLARFGSFDYDMDANQVRWSEELFRIFGMPVTKENVPLDLFFERIHPEDREGLMEQIKEMLRGERTELIHRIVLPDGTEKVVRSQLENASPSSRSNVIFGIVQDITESTRTEKQLKDSKQQYLSLIQYNPDAICAINLNGLFINANPAFEKLIGYSESEMFNLEAAELLFEEEMGKLEAMRKLSYDQLFSEQFEIRLRRRDGQAVYADVSFVPIMRDNQLSGIYLILKDRTEQRQTEEMLRRSERLSAVGQLAAAVAHEIRNPLTALKGFIKLLQNTPPGQVSTRYFQIINDELERIELFTGELLFLSKPQAERYLTLHLPVLLEEVVVLLNTQAIMGNVEILSEWSGDDFYVLGEPNQIKQVFVNLLKNAIEAMPSGGRVRVKLASDGQSVSVTIIDQGVGIPAEKIARLGEPFYTTKDRGTGLGLMITYKIIEAHRGKITISSRIGKGTTVAVSFPLAEDNPQAG